MGDGKPGFGPGGPGFGPGTGFRPGTPVAPDVEAKIAKVAAKINSREDLAKVLITYARGRGIQMLDQWLTQCLSAKSDSKPPAEEESKSYWVIALIGNLAWAATCFIPGAGIVKAAVDAGDKMTSLGKAFYGGLALGGATAGSGTVQQLSSDPSSTPDGKDAVSAMLNKQRKKLEDILNRSLEGFVYRLFKSKTFDPERYSSETNAYLIDLDHALWSEIFPGIDYEKLDEIYESSLKAITKALAEFNSQYKAWKQVIEARVRYAFTPRHGGMRYLVDSQGRSWEENYKYQMELFPFKPKLNFYG